METEALYMIGGMFSLCVLFCRYRTAAEEEVEDSEIEPELMNELLEDLRAYAAIAKKVTITRPNGEVVAIEYKSDERKEEAPTAVPESKMVWSEDKRSLAREAVWGGEQ